MTDTLDITWTPVEGHDWPALYALVDGTCWTLACLPSLPSSAEGWHLYQIAYPAPDFMGTTDEAVARERAAEQITAWHKHHQGGDSRG